MTPDEGFSLLKDANPVPDPFGYLEVLSQGSSVIAPHELRRRDMQSIDVKTKTLKPARKPNRWMAVAVVAVMAVLAAVVVTVTREAPIASSRGDAELAIQRANDFLAARNAAELQAAAGPDLAVPRAMMTEWEWWSAFAEAGYRGDVGPCTTTGARPSIFVDCPLTPADPVMLALGVEDLELRFQFFPAAGDAGQMKVPGYIDYRANGAAEAYGAYLSAFDPDAYAESCSPAAYESASILSSAVAFTPECARALIPYLDEIAVWVENGRPAP
jgi:hypothetical protein